MSLAEAAAAMQARALGPDIHFDGVSTDTRSIGRGELFVAIRGDRFDGHEFLAVARERGAAAALIDERYKGEAPLPVLIADDTRRGLGRLGRHWRLRFAPALIAITGSNGKTTTKEMLASILRVHAGEAGSLATRGNLNTDIGVPLTLLGLRASHRYCAIELGMNHPGEIALLADIARPTVALVNNAQREHLEFMQSVEAVAEENASVFDALPADGVAVLNADDAMADVFRQKAGSRRRVEFGMNSGTSPGAILCARSTAKSSCKPPQEKSARRSRFPACTTCATRSRPRPARMPRAFRRRRSARACPPSGPTAGACR